MGTIIILMFIYTSATNTAEVRSFASGEACELSRRPVEDAQRRNGNNTFSTACTALNTSLTGQVGSRTLGVYVDDKRVATINGFSDPAACDAARLTVFYTFPAMGRTITTICDEGSR